MLAGTIWASRLKWLSSAPPPTVGQSAPAPTGPAGCCAEVRPANPSVIAPASSHRLPLLVILFSPLRRCAGVVQSPKLAQLCLARKSLIAGAGCLPAGKLH